MSPFVSLRLSLVISGLSTLLAVAVGLPLAWHLSRANTRRATVLDVIVHVPLALPPTVLGYFLLVLLGRDGPLGKLIFVLFGRTLIFTPSAAVIAAAIVSLPLFVQATRNALGGIPRETVEAARIEGATNGQIFRHIGLPLAWSGVWTGALLAYARALGEFGATLMVAGNIPGKTQTMALAIYAAVQAGDDKTAQHLSLVLVGIAALSVGISQRLRRHHPYG